MFPQPTPCSLSLVPGRNTLPKRDCEARASHGIIGAKSQAGGDGRPRENGRFDGFVASVSLRSVVQPS